MNCSPSSVPDGNPLKLAAVLSLLLGVLRPCAVAALEPLVRLPVRTLMEMRQANVVRQGWDLSCGAAALSTLLTYEQRDPVGELEIIRTILRRTPVERIRARHGFSLLDLKRFAVARGYRAEGFGGLDTSDLGGLAPAIVPLSMGDLHHFVVVRGIEADHVILADPAFGNRTMTLGRFEELWSSRIAFTVRREWPGIVQPARDEVLRGERPPLVPSRVIGQRLSLGGGL